MKIEIDSSSSTGLSSVKMTHGDESITWDVSAYARTSERAASLDTDKIFEEINAYWATLKIERLDAIWEIYKKIRIVLDTNYDSISIENKLQKLVKQLYDLMPLAEITHWTKFHSNVRIPTNLKDTYGPQESQERTYLRGDYEQLAVLAIALRPMVPVWGEFIFTIKREVGNTDKELHALKLLYYSELVRSVPFMRLRTFVESSVAHTPQQGPSLTAVLGGLGSTELPEWVLALTCVRRLALGEVSSQDDSSNIITNVYQYVVNTLKSMDRKFGGKFGGKVSDKIQPGGSSEEAKASVVEGYKVKQEVPDGDLVTVNIYTENPIGMAAQVEPELNPELVQLCLHHVHTLDNQSIQPHQVTLVQWLLDPVLPRRGIPLLQKPALLRAMAVTQALLWHWGFYDIAALVTATPLISDQNMLVGAMKSRGRIPRELMAELAVVFPHHSPGRGKQQTQHQLNVGAKAVDLFVELITRSDWTLHAPLDLIERTSRVDNTKKLIVPADIRAQLAKLLIQIATAR